MSFSVLLNVVAVPQHVSIAWDKAEQRIDQLETDDLSPFYRYWDPDGELEAEARADLPGSVARAKAELRVALAEVRGAMAGGHTDLRTFELGEVRFFATGGGSVGETPSNLYDRVSGLESLGLLTAAGFKIVIAETGPTEAELAAM